MLYEFRLAFDVLASNAAPGFTDTEIYSLLNKAEDYLVLELVNTKKYDLVYTLISNNTPTTASGGSGLYYISLPVDYWLPLETYSSITRIGFTNSGFVPTQAMSGEMIKNIPIDAKDNFKYLQSAFNGNKIYKFPYAYVEGTNQYVISDLLTTVNDINIKYIKSRTAIGSSTNSELPIAAHRLIVDQAVKYAQESVFSQLPNKQ